MNSTEINNVINNLCERFGTTTTYLIPEMTKYNITRDLVMIILSIIPLVLAIIIWLIGHKRYEKTIEEEKFNNGRAYTDAGDFIGYWMVSGLAFLVFFVMFTVNMYDLIGWISSPTAAFTELLFHSLN